MKTTLLSTVAAVALVLSVGAVSAQDKAPNAGGSSSGTMERSTTSPSSPSGGAMERGTSGSERQPGAVEHTQTPPRADRQAQTPSTGTKADERNAQAPADNKANSRMGAEKSAPDRTMQHTGDNAKPGMNDKGGASAQSDTRAKSTVGAAPTSETRMTTEQRTEIRQKVIATGPKVTNVNFSLNVGTMVPNTVRVVEVPPVIIELHPEWRGYRYFVANDRVIIIDRDTLRIVAVLDV